MRKLNSLLFLFLILLAFSCNKDKDPAPVACTFTFKNKTYTANVVMCEPEATGTIMSTFGQDSGGNLWTLTLGSNMGAGDIWIGIGDIAYLLEANDNHTLSFKDNTYTFSGTLYNKDDNTDFATTSGTCTCTEER